MTKTSLILAAVVTFIFTAVLFAGEPPTSHLGTWQLISAKYGDEKEFSDVSKGRRQIKMLTANHYIWVNFDDKTKLVSNSMGGSYTLDGEKYTETVDYFLPEGMGIYLGKKQEFTLKIDGDKLTQTGKLSDGTKIAEVWQRVK